MKKLFVLVALFTTICVANANAQDTKPASDPAKSIESYKEKLKPLLMDEVKLTEAQAERVIKIHFAYAKRLQHFDSAPVEERKKQAEIIRGIEDKEYTAMSLSSEKITAIHAFFDKQKKKADQK